jgi:serine/threonine protein kinase
MSGDAHSRPPVGVAPSVAMDGPLLPRRGLSVGAVGVGTEGRRYRLLVPLQRGGMGELFLAVASQPGHPDRHVVIKRLLADLIDDPKYVAMFQSEAEIMARLHHRNIVGVYDTPVIDRAQCLAMELVRGRRPADPVPLRGPGRVVPPTLALEIMAGILRGLDYAHNLQQDDGAPLNLVHRDVSPGNVLVAYTGEVKLTDFGIAKSQMSVVSTTVGIVKGKARYLAPEQILGEPASPRSDIFSAACVTCELLTGVPTFDCSSVPKTLYAIVNGQREDLTDQLAFEAPALVHLLNRALATSPTERIQTARALAEGFEAQARALAPRGGGLDLGTWLTALFAGEDDPVREALGPELPLAPPPPRTPVEDEATEHGYSAAAPLPSMSGPHTELVDRPAGVPAFRATVGGMDTEPPDVPVARARARTVVEAELVDPPVEVAPRDDTEVVRRRNRRQHPDAPPPQMDEALSMLAFLQAQQHPVAPSATRPMRAAEAPAPRAPARPAPPRDPEPLPDLRPRAGGKLAFMTLGLALGIGGTLAVQALLPKPPPVAAPLPALVEAPPPAAPPPVAVVAPPPEPEPAEAVEEAVEEPAPLEVPARAPATLTVATPKGARVRLDGRLLPGKVPLEAIEVPPGDHELKVVKGRYKRQVEFTAAPGAHYELKKRVERVE